jgi:hypothetical protein
MHKLILLVFFVTGCAGNGDMYTNITYTNIHESNSEISDDFTTLVCKTKLVNFKNKLTLEDKRALNSAKERCKFYYPDAPCLKKFIKKGNQIYHAICGKYNGDSTND